VPLYYYPFILLSSPSSLQHGEFSLIPASCMCDPYHRHIHVKNILVRCSCLSSMDCIFLSWLAYEAPLIFKSLWSLNKGYHVWCRTAWAVAQPKKPSMPFRCGNLVSSANLVPLYTRMKVWVQTTSYWIHYWILEHTLLYLDSKRGIWFQKLYGVFFWARIKMVLHRY
jgi:hypothetical protein